MINKGEIQFLENVSWKQKEGLLPIETKEQEKLETILSLPDVTWEQQEIMYFLKPA